MESRAAEAVPHLRAALDLAPGLTRARRCLDLAQRQLTDSLPGAQ